MGDAFFFPGFECCLPLHQSSHNLSHTHAERVAPASLCLQLSAMCRSGLLETTAVTATVLGGAVPRGVQSEGRISATEGGSPGQFEFATLRKLQAYCEATPDARVLYFHNSE